MKKEAVKKPKRRMPLKNFIRIYGRMIIGGSIIAVVVFCAIFRDFLVPFDPFEIHYLDRFQTPNSTYLLGTDALGRDMLSRVIWGARDAVILGIGVQLFGVLVGAICGAICGYYKKVDLVLMRVMEGLSAIPSLLLLMIIVAIVGSGIPSVMIALIVGQVPGVCRMTRSRVLSLRQKEFIEAEKTMGASTLRILIMHILPSCIDYLAIRFCSGIGGAITSTAGLAYLGVGLDPTAPNWGSMVNQGQDYFTMHPHMIIVPGLVITIVVFGFVFFGEGLREKLDPKLK